MGSFFGSVYLRTDGLESVWATIEKVARKQKGRFLLAPPLRGWVAVYPDNSGQAERVSRAIARQFPGEVLHVVVHDDDIFCYFFYRAGRLVDRYNSFPDYFAKASAAERRKCRGQPDLLAGLLAPGRTLEELQELLAPDQAEASFPASDLLQRFAQLLDLPNAETSYEYLQAGETYDVEGWDDFLHVPDLGPEKARQREAEAGLDREKQRLRDEGLLLLEKSGSGFGVQITMPAWCPDREGSGFLACWCSVMTGPAPCPVERYGPPWAADAAPTGLMLPGPVHQLAASPSGRYLAASGVSGTLGAQLWDLDGNTLAAEVPHGRVVDWLGFTPDEKLLITLSPEEGHVTSVQSGRRVASFSVPRSQRAAVHPSGIVIVADVLGQLVLVDATSGQVRKALYLGGRQDAGSLLGMLGAGAHQELQQRVQQEMEKLDPDALEAQVRAGMEKQIRAFEQGLKRAGARPGMPDPEEMIRRMRENMKAAVERMKQGLAIQKQNPALFATPPMGAERPTCLECGPDGRFLFCATDKGVRVFAWENLLTASEVTPPPVLSAAAQPATVQLSQGPMTMPGHIHALAHDAGADRLLLGGVDGRVRFLDLKSGREGVLLDPPERAAILRMALSRDGSALCCTCMPDLFGDGRSRKPPLIQVWNYSALRI
jgi:hypothetical protein